MDYLGEERRGDCVRIGVVKVEVQVLWVDDLCARITILRTLFQIASEFAGRCEDRANFAVTLYC